ncbi:MAG: alkane 1-monooxygenase [Myxococcota bacterium]|nr:alkane 1-monooxygenase [Myxococcota bacterium]
MKPLHYLFVFVIPALTVVGLFLEGPWVWLAPVMVFGLVPILELFLPAPQDNDDEETLMSGTEDWRYDAVLYAAVPTQVGVVVLFLWLVSSGALTGLDLVGATMAVGLCCGGLGINIGHELGHRKDKRDQLLAKLLLSTSLYAHFFIEHNRGHHSRVATHDDPATSRRGELLYSFWWRSVVGGWRSAWEMEAKRLTRRGRSVLSLENEMLRLQLAQAGLVAGAFLVLGASAGLAFLAVAVLGILLLETVNYLEHYGLKRSQSANGRWERVRPAHSWNSNCLLGRLLLFNLTRHSDHHAHPKRPYSALRHFDEAPQLPTGYPGMVMVALVPPLFFALMDPRLPDAAPASTPAIAA